ncbi:MAG: enolase C-terminal domain-like protein, partial [Armatimonadota bacterium]
CGPDFVSWDLSKYLGPEFKDRYVTDYLLVEYKPEIPVFHLVGGMDKLTRGELDDTDPDDGIPNCLEDWVARDGVFCLKVKLRGNDLDWDLDRTLAVYKVGRRELDRLGINSLHLTADTNEQCDGPEYIVEYLNKTRERDVACYEAILYVEQPTERDLSVSRHDMRCIAEMKPVLVDESLTDLESFDLAMELGWSGIALKSCKGQSADMIFVAKAEHLGIPYAVQDLTNPSLALFHSVGLAARINTIMGVEANSRQFFPAATSPAERSVHEDIFTLRRGLARTHSLKGPGLGYQMEKLRAAGWARI